MCLKLSYYHFQIKKWEKSLDTAIPGISLWYHINFITGIGKLGRHREIKGKHVISMNLKQNPDLMDVYLPPPSTFTSQRL